MIVMDCKIVKWIVKHHIQQGVFVDVVEETHNVMNLQRNIVRCNYCRYH